MTAVPLGDPAHWFPDQRGGGRGVRVSAHAEAGFLVLSTWRDGTCASTVRLNPEQAAALVSGIAEGLADLSQG
jgi:hypothetical protein